MAPFKRAEKYRPIGKFLLNNRKISIYKDYCEEKKEISGMAHIVPRRGSVPDRIIEGEKIAIPIFEIAVNPQIKFYEKIKYKDIKIKMEESIEKIIDTEVLSCIFSASRPTQTVHYQGDLSISTINFGISLLEQHNLKANKIVMHPSKYADLRLFGSDVIENGWLQKIKNFLFNTHGKIFGADIYVCNRVPQNCVYILPKSDLVGILYSTKIQRHKAKEITQLRYSHIAYKRVGIVCMNDYAIVRLEEDIPPPQPVETPPDNTQSEETQERPETNTNAAINNTAERITVTDLNPASSIEI